MSCTGSREASLIIPFTLKKVAGAIREHGLFRCGDTVVVAVSGGADSVALLDLLASLKELDLTLVVAHLNHCLRGPESDGDAAFVADLARRLGLPADMGTADVRDMSRQRKLSLEEAGRAARYEWLRDVARARGADRVALGHHADDLAQTFLLNLFFEGKPRSMPPVLHSGDGRNTVIRPLAYCMESDIAAFAALQGYPILPCGLCGEQGELQRRRMGRLVDELEKEIPDIRSSIRSALKRFHGSAPPEAGID